MREREGILVRPFTHHDTEQFYSAVRNSIDALSYWMPWCTPAYSLEDAQTWITYTERAWAEHIEFPLGVFDARSGEVIGGTGINHLNVPCHMGNLGYWTATTWCGRGVARVAARMAAEIAFHDLGLTRLEILALPHNSASRRVAEAIGATQECCARHRLYFQGKPHDAIVYSLLPDDLSSGI